MPRHVRLEYEGALYHAMCRENRREDIFADEEIREMFISTLAQSVERAGWLQRGHVLMSTHYNLVLETPRANFMRGMTWLPTSFTTRFNGRQRRTMQLHKRKNSKMFS